MFKKLISAVSVFIRKVLRRYPTDIKNPDTFTEEEYIFDDGSNPFES